MRPIYMSARSMAAIGALGFVTTLAALPDSAQSDSQGAVSNTTTTTTTAPVPATVAVAPKPVRVTLRVSSARRNVIAGRRTIVRGVLRHGNAGHAVKLQLRRGHRWVTVARSHTRSQGRYRLRYTPQKTGSFKARVSFHGDRTARAARRKVGTINVYRRVLASWYGGGGAVACPGSSGRAALGVANKTLPCGTMVTLRYHGRTVRAKVVDRGPFVAGREYDLTAATKNALGAGDLTTIMSTR
jgi:rare lipoprotein A